ncbi:MAG: hypothetical protein MK074_05125 [Phycisphaerales bacterium]|nr:hypothetical protein [Phycisphaerales bacterium]
MKCLIPITVCLSALALSPWAAADGAPAAFGSSPVVRPVLLDTDLSRLTAYLGLDGMQKAAVRALLKDQRVEDEAAIAELRASLGDMWFSSEDELEDARARWGEQWDRRAFPVTTNHGQLEIRDIALEWMDTAPTLGVEASEPAEALAQFVAAQDAARAALMRDVAVVLDGDQLERWGTADAAAALARSSWPAVLPQERLDLDALLVEVLGDGASAPVWVQRRAQWIRHVGASIARRDAVLRSVEPALLDAHVRRQPALHLAGLRTGLEARRAHAAVLNAVRADMSNALPFPAVNIFQREAQRRMYPDLYDDDRIDRLARAAVQLEHLDDDARDAVNAAWARHRSRRLAVQAHLTACESSLSERVVLRPVESRLMRGLFGPSIGLLPLWSDADGALAHANRLHNALEDARDLAESELRGALPESAWPAVVNAARRREIGQRNAHAAGMGDLSLPGATDVVEPSP